VEDLEARLRKLSVGQNNLRPQDDESSSQESLWNDLTKVDSALSVASSKRSSVGTMSIGSSGALSEHSVDTLYLGYQEKIPRDMSIYRGRTTGVEIMRSLRDLCDTFVDLPTSPDHPAAKMVEALDFQAPFENLPMVSAADSFFALGPMIGRWIDIAFDEAFILFPFIDRKMFKTYVRRLFDGEASDQDGCDNDHIGLLHVIVALGQRHDPNLITLDSERSKSVETRGSVLLTYQRTDFKNTDSDYLARLRHFAAARKMVPLEDCSHSVTAVQTVLCMALYLKSVSAQRAVHTYVSAACFAS
jgi:hypothetical protein